LLVHVSEADAAQASVAEAPALFVTHAWIELACVAVLHSMVVEAAPTITGGVVSTMVKTAAALLDLPQLSVAVNATAADPVPLQLLTRLV